MNEFHSQSTAVARIRSMMPKELLSKADRIATINGRYVGLDRDFVVNKAIKASIASIAVSDLTKPGKPDKRRILALCGESGAGKTTALLAHVAATPEMQPYEEDGNLICPVLMMTAPSPCTPGLFAYEGLHALGYPVRKSMKENALWETFRRVLKAHQVLWLIVDEAQHTVDAANTVEMTKIGNALKNLVQMSDWPLRLILAGVEPLNEFLTRKQLNNRSTIIKFPKMSGPTGEATMAGVISKIVVEHAELSTSVHHEQDFLSKLMHSCDSDFGTMIQMIRGAVEEAIFADEDVVTNEHFAQCFKSNTGNEDHENVFLVKDWASIKPYAAARREADNRLSKFYKTMRK